MNRVLRRLIMMVFVLLPPQQVAAQSYDSTRATRMKIIGVFDPRSGEPIAGVLVRDIFTGTSVVTSATGTARLDFISYRGGAAIVQLQKVGFEAKQIFVNRGDTNSVTEVLEPATALAPMVTTEKYVIARDAGLREGFAMRCTSKSVTCFDAREIEKHPLANVADLLIHAEGVTLGGCGGGKGKWMANRNGLCNTIAMKPTAIPPAFCYPTFFIDGFEWDSSMGSPIDSMPGHPAVGAFTPSNIVAIEVYPPEKPRPLRFSGNPICGAVVIWTK
jgi:hypothetical protein